MTHKHQKQKGSSMIEVLIALVILSVGLLGLAMLQGQSMKLNSDAMFRSQATLLANEIIENMRVNALGANAGLYVISSKPAACGSCNDTNGALSANRDLITWYEAQAATLPSPTSSITLSGTTYTINMKWNERGTTITQAWEVTI